MQEPKIKPGTERAVKEAQEYGELALKWASLHDVFAGANATLAAHKAYIALGRGRGIPAKIIPIFDTGCTL